MPRVEQPLVPDGSALVGFAIDLRLLRARAGLPAYRELARLAHYASTTLAEAAAGRKLPSLDVTLAFVRACGGNEIEWKERWHAVATELNARAAVPGPVDEVAVGAPYFGLRSFGPDDAGLFFGRERLVSEVLDRLGERRIAVLFGASGSGKSSVLRAGVVPELRARGTVVSTFAPGARPIEQGCVHLASVLGVVPSVVADEWWHDERGLHRLVLQALVGHDERAEMVVVVDQFEEVFALCRDTAERERFIAGLITAASTEGSRCRVALSVRSDFFAHFSAHPSLLAALPEGQVVVGPMTTDELRRAIVEPAMRKGCAVESRLLAELIAQAHGRTGVLPLLSHVLLQVWGRRSGSLMTLSAYQAGGGLDGALSRTAEEIYNSFNAQQRRTAKTLFGRLVALGEGTEDTRRRLDTAELDEDSTLEAVLDTLIRARLLIRDHDALEITHEALIRAWPRLRQWLEDDRDDLRLHRQLADAAHTWLSLNRAPDALLRGARLDATREWADRGGPASAAEQEFLDASISADQAARAVARRRARRLRQFVAVLTVLVVVLTGMTAYAVVTQRTATSERNNALSLRAADAALVLAEDDSHQGLLLALAAYRVAPTAEALNALRVITAGQGEYIFGTDLSADEHVHDVGPQARFIVTTRPLNPESPYRLWSVDRDKYVSEIWKGRYPPVFSPEGRFVALSEERLTRLWDVTDQRHPRVIATLNCPTLIHSISESGETMAGVSRVPDGVIPEGAPVPPQCRSAYNVMVWRNATNLSFPLVRARFVRRTGRMTLRKIVHLGHSCIAQAQIPRSPLAPTSPGWPGSGRAERPLDRSEL
ncbi:XRE family transcriptional regulator [Actinosynnema sp. CS-041913]|uniref:nSTAND1 domain-containing NTPase n=1 Tax=Actinosynnema sp. CS-041913 TaxID=3239917 RepID=UPI003D8D1BA7